MVRVAECRDQLGQRQNDAGRADVYVASGKAIGTRVPADRRLELRISGRGPNASADRIAQASREQPSVRPGSRLRLHIGGDNRARW
jgi:hypothetical protein